MSACRTTIDRNSIFRNRQCISAAVVETAFCTLGLRQYGQNPVNQPGFVFFRIFHIAIIANFPANKKAVSPKLTACPVKWPAQSKVGVSTPRTLCSFGEVVVY